MNYQECRAYIDDSAKYGSVLGLDNMREMLDRLGNPQDAVPYVHVAGTNGKGSCSHTIAAVLQSAGYRVGLFTSPHLVDFRERIRINGEMTAGRICSQLCRRTPLILRTAPSSFFELTTAMAFRYFADQKVDVAVIEVGMGGRLDLHQHHSTPIYVSSLISVLTTCNI